MTNYAELAGKLKPYILPWLTTGGGAMPTGGMSAHALSGPYHTGQLAQSQAPWAATVAALNAHIASASHLNSSSAGPGLTFTSGAFAVGAGAGVTVNADDVALTTPGTLTVNTTNVASGNHTHAITTSSNPGAAASILQSTSSGGLTLQALAATISVATPLLTTAAGAMNITPVGNLILDPATVVLDPSGNNVQPLNNYDINLGTINKKYLTLHAAELWVETLVAQNTIATIGGRILVGPTTVLVADVATGDTTITVKHNEMAVGDRVYMEADGKVEFMAIAGGPGGSAGAYIYTVTRNLDGTGANVWYAGDAIFNMGVAGEGWIDLYSLRGVKSATEYGPTIVGNVRLSDTYNDWAPRWALGNLNGLYDYATTRYGFAAGNPATAWIAADASNGFRIMLGAVERFRVTQGGNLRINDSTGENMIALDSDGKSYFAGRMTIGTNGEIVQGTGTLGTEGTWPASPTLWGTFTGLRMGRDGSVGRIGGYNGGTLQWYGATDGKFYFAGGNGTLNYDGITLNSVSGATFDPQKAYTFKNASAVFGGLYSKYGSPIGHQYVHLIVDSTDDLRPNVGIIADGTDAKPGVAFIRAETTSTAIQISANAAGGYIGMGGASIWADDGSNTAPMYSFYSNNNTGMYNVQANEIGFAAGGAHTASILGGVGLYIPTGYVVTVPYGSAGAPSYTFNTDSNTGFYNTGDNTPGVAAGGINIAKFGPSYVQITDTADNNIGKLKPGSFTLAADATATIPDVQALVIIHNSTDGTSALYWIAGAGNNATEISDRGNGFSVTKNTDNQLNLYYDSGTSGYTLQNTYAATKTIHIMMVGTATSF